MFRLKLFFGLALAVLASQVDAALMPAEVAVVAARGNAASEKLAGYYATARGIPATQICLVDVPAGDSCSREQWSESIRPAIRQWLDENDPERRLRCLVTVWGMPLKISAAAPTPELLAYQKFLSGERLTRLATLKLVIKEFDLLAPAGAISTDAVGGGGSGRTGSRAAAPPPPFGSPEEAPWLSARLDAALKGAQERITNLPEGPVRHEFERRLRLLVTEAGGANILVQNLQQQLSGQTDPDLTQQAELHRLRGISDGWIEAIKIIELRPRSIDRDASILAIIDRTGGVLAAIEWLEKQIADAAKNETGAALDSELALVLWADDYELLRWHPNYLSHSYDRSYLRKAFPTLMVARLDAPTPELARGLVDAAIEVEKTGLAGKAYFDSRGLAHASGVSAAAAQGENAEFDRALLATSDGIKNQTTIPVTVNDQPSLFQAGECSDAALYCGWYSLGKYVDAFQWNRGAVAFHAGGDEADGLHDLQSQRWCKRLLEDGVAATIGAVNEPYLSAFPLPGAFLAPLLSGETLAESYWQAQPYTSWSMVLIGDPLYRPFMNRKVKREESVIRDAGR